MQCGIQSTISALARRSTAGCQSYNARYKPHRAGLWAEGSTTRTVRVEERLVALLLPVNDKT